MASCLVPMARCSAVDPSSSAWFTARRAPEDSSSSRIFTATRSPRRIPERSSSMDDCMGAALLCTCSGASRTALIRWGIDPFFQKLLGLGSPDGAKKMLLGEVWSGRRHKFAGKSVVVETYRFLGSQSESRALKFPALEHFYQHTCTIYRDGARHPRHLNARVGVLLLLK